jgi:hypothetical protein
MEILASMRGWSHELKAKSVNDRTHTFVSGLAFHRRSQELCGPRTGRSGASCNPDRHIKQLIVDRCT